MNKLEPYSKNWQILYKIESEKIREVLVGAVTDIQHIGSTSIPNMKAKPIIDIAAMVDSFDKIEDLIQRLSDIGYVYYQQKSSSERYFFEKNDAYHLSITIPTVSFRRRQILFRDYLIEHPEIAKEYEILKESLLNKSVDGTSGYIEGKTEFVNKVLKLADI
ncbi:MAG: GrpB family protein [bacterium]|nr:GrpB family protein [bacterium]